MAIDSIPYPETTNLAHASEKSFYPVRIPVSHWQLRHYISTPEPDHLYYASGHDIYCLNTATKKRKHIALLPFEARCTASGYGWVCVGGEDEGHFAAIKLDGSGPRTLGVDEALPIGERWPQTGNGTRRAASVKVERIGEEIVNSISIHRIQDEEAHLDDIVAVLTNNDKTVRIYSLPQSLETTVLDLPFPMNHATISPDGQTMIVVGDQPMAYFFQREISETPPQIPKPHNRLTSASIEWELTNVVKLHVSAGPIETTTHGYFTTAWSPSGHLVAVGSEGGYVTVFDMDLLANQDLEDEEAIVAVVPSSRPDIPQPHPGAVRTLMFAPDPWDLLIWAEDQGRVCIGDLRTGLKSKQVVHLEPKAEGLKRVEYEDLPSDHLPSFVPTTARDVDDLEADFLRRHRAPDNATAVNFATEYIEARRRQRQQRQDMAALRAQQANSPGMRAVPDDEPRGLTSQEQQILETLRTTRQREEARAGGHIPRSVNYTTPDMFTSNPTRSSSSATPETSSSSSSARPISEILSSVPDSFPELSRTSPRPDPSLTLPPLHTSSPNAWTRSTGLVRLSDGSRLPRRRASVVLSPPINTTAPSSAVPASSITTNARHETAAAAADEENPWRTIEEHMQLARGPLFEHAARAPPVPTSSAAADENADLQAELAAERARARSLARQRDRWRNLRLADSPAAAAAGNGHGSAGGAGARLPTNFPEGYEMLARRSRLRTTSSGTEGGVRTAGLAISEDGGTLWVASEEGIFEVGVNLRGRLFLPAREVK